VELFWQRVGDRYRDRHGLAVLDIGARHGEALAFVAERVPGARLTAPELVESFHAHLRSIGAEVIAADLERPRPAALAGRFDLVIFRHTPEHLEQPLQALRNIAAALSPGGMVYIAVPNAMTGRPGQPMRTDFFRPVHAHYFNRPTLIRLAARAGLHPVRCEAEGELWGLFGTAPREDDAAPGDADGTCEAQLTFMRTRLAAGRRADLRAILRILARRLLSRLRS
jgi:SAM-dependent methyltransferase